MLASDVVDVSITSAEIALFAIVFGAVLTAGLGVLVKWVSGRLTKQAKVAQGEAAAEVKVAAEKVAKENVKITRELDTGNGKTLGQYVSHVGHELSDMRREILEGRIEQGHIAENVRIQGSALNDHIIENIEVKKEILEAIAEIKEQNNGSG